MSEWDKKFTELEQQLVQERERRGAVATKSEVEDRVMQLKEQWDTFQATKASQSELDQLTKTVSMLIHTKVNKTDFNSLSSDVSDLRETVSTKADDDTVHKVVESVVYLSLNFTMQINHIIKTLSTKAAQQDVDQLTNQIPSKWTTLSITALEVIVHLWIGSNNELLSTFLESMTKSLS